MLVPLSDAVSPSIDLWSHGSLDVAWDHCMQKKTRWFFMLIRWGNQLRESSHPCYIPVTAVVYQASPVLIQIIWHLQLLVHESYSTDHLKQENKGVNCVHTLAIYIAAQLKLFLHYSHKQIVLPVLCLLFFAFFVMDIHAHYPLWSWRGNQTHLHSIKTIPRYLLHCKFPQNNTKTVHIRSAEWP